MGRGYESPQAKAKRLAQQAINQVKNPQQKAALAKSLGYTLGTGKAQGFLQGGAGVVSNQAAERVVKAIESATKPSSNSRAASMGATQVDIAEFKENLGETPREEYERKQREAREYEQRPFREAEAAEQQAREAQSAYERQLQEQARIKGEVQAELAKAERQAQIAGRRSAATSARLRSQSMLEQSQVQQAAVRTGQAIQGQQRKQPGTTVGQPGRTRTRVASGLGIGGYGGTRAARVSPTGLNI
jgi:hypothetical protein